MQRKCFAKWHEDERGNAYRDGTILQYGNGWELLGNVILLNPAARSRKTTFQQTTISKNTTLISPMTATIIPLPSIR